MSAVGDGASITSGRDSVLPKNLPGVAREFADADDRYDIKRDVDPVLLADVTPTGWSDTGNDDVG